MRGLEASAAGAADENTSSIESVQSTHATERMGHHLILRLHGKEPD